MCFIMFPVTVMRKEAFTLSPLLEEIYPIAWHSLFRGRTLYIRHEIRRVPHLVLAVLHRWLHFSNFLSVGTLNVVTGCKRRNISSGIVNCTRTKGQQ
jgi:hypothetical protein